MKNSLIAACAATAVVATTIPSHAEEARWSVLSRALAGIPSVAHGNALAAITNCGMKVKKADSWMDDMPDKPGWKLLQVMVDLPPIPGDKDPYPYKDVLLRWEIKGKTAIPTSGTAETVQRSKEILHWRRC
ncbi:hypothetical protein [Aquitalea magnusonii]|uniref:hypothetical protein n=1 Tax=Aquitalea magnusonii TaxID=332411 RepID=UPI00075005C3|nr:hypothetical protein [Aquitalea magnusonii]